MSRPSFVADPVAQMVAAARPDAAASRGGVSLFPLNQLGAQHKLALTDLRATIRLPAGKLLADFRIGEVSVDPSGGVATVSADKRFFRIALEPSLRIHAVVAAIDATYRVAELSYDFGTRRATCRVTVDSADVSLAAALTDDIAEAIASKLVEAVGATSMGKRGYSLFRDPSPLATLRTAVSQFALHKARQDADAFNNNRGVNGLTALLRQQRDDALAGLFAPERRVGLHDMRLTSVAMSFTPTGVIEQPSKSGANALRLTPGSSLRVSAILDADLATLQSAVPSGGGPIPTVVAVAPSLNLRSVVIDGSIHLVYAREHVATLRRLRITPDGFVDITEFELTRLTEKKVAVEGINLMDVDRAANSLLGALFAVIALTEAAGGIHTAVELAKRRPELLTPVVSAAVENHQSRLVEPVVRHMAEAEIEQALTAEVRDFLHETVEAPLGMTLETLLGGKPHLTLP